MIFHVDCVRLTFNVVAIVLTWIIIIIIIIIIIRVYVSMCRQSVSCVDNSLDSGEQHTNATYLSASTRMSGLVSQLWPHISLYDI